MISWTSGEAPKGPPRDNPGDAHGDPPPGELPGDTPGDTPENPQGERTKVIRVLDPQGCSLGVGGFVDLSDVLADLRR